MASTLPQGTPPTPSTPLGSLANKLFAARSAVEFNALMEEFRVEHRALVLTEAAEKLDRIADETEAKVAEHYGQASGIGPGSADMVREAARTVRSLAARTIETVHACPPGNSSLTPCCGRTPFELSRTDRLTYDEDQITCQAARTAP